MSIARRLMLIIAACAASALSSPSVAQESVDYANHPPVFMESDFDFPLTGMGVEIPPPGKIVPAVDLVDFEASEFRRNGESVQPTLNAKFNTAFVGGLYGISRKWAAELIVPWRRTRISGDIGGFPAGASVEAVGGIMIGGKRRLWTGGRGQEIVLTGLLQLPTGLNHATFDSSNAATNAYYRGYPRRLPISWQPSSGTWNGLLGVAYGQREQRFSYAAIAATKIHSPDDEDTKIGDIFMLAGTATYGVSSRLALSLGATLRVQADDDYPEAPAPGIDQPLLAGTTQHGTTFYLNPSFRFIALRNIAIGLGWRIPVSTPDDGAVPETKLDVIFYPGL